MTCASTSYGDARRVSQGCARGVRCSHRVAWPRRLPETLPETRPSRGRGDGDPPSAGATHLVGGGMSVSATRRSCALSNEPGDGVRYSTSHVTLAGLRSRGRGNDMARGARGHSSTRIESGADIVSADTASHPDVDPTSSDCESVDHESRGPATLSGSRVRVSHARFSSDPRDSPPLRASSRCPNARAPGCASRTRKPGTRDLGESDAKHAG